MNAAREFSVPPEKLFWTVWDAHAALGDTYQLRQKITAQISEIVGLHLKARKPIRHTQNEQAKKLIQKMRREGKIKPTPPAEPPEGFLW